MHEWMRQKQVDILTYLPKFLAKDDRFKATNDADSKEHEKIRILLQDVFDQLFVDSVTWGIEKWESLLAIMPKDGATLEERRATIKSKLITRKSVTNAFLSGVASESITNGKAEIIEDNPDYSFMVDVNADGSPLHVNYDEMFRIINRYKPAHLGYGLRINEKVYGPESFLLAFAVDQNDEAGIYPSNDIEIAASGTEHMGAAFLMEIGQTVMYSVIPDTTEGRMEKYMGAAISQGDVIDIYPFEKGA